jgi:hypothetical protein
MTSVAANRRFGIDVYHDLCARTPQFFFAIASTTHRRRRRVCTSDSLNMLQMYRSPDVQHVEIIPR